MLRVISCGVMVLAFSAGSAGVVHAQWGQPCVSCCPTCTAVAPPPVTQTYVQPVISTQYRQQQQISYRDVAQTEYRQEAYYQSVPVTTYENVTVDEGGYQQVWVPKLVTKTVAKQGYQTQLSQRTVPFQVTRRIPQVTTQYIPEQRISYQTSYTTSYLPSVYSTYNTALLPPLTTPIIAAAPVAAPVASHSIPRRTADNSSLAPVPDPEFDESGSAISASRPTTIPRRTASNDRYDGYRDSPHTASKFVPAPSAAMVWQTPRGTSYR